MRAFLLIILLPLLYITPTVANDAIERLFFTRAQREDLERLRTANQQGVMTTVTDPKMMEPQPKLPDKVEVQGYVKRYNDEQNTVWVNGEALYKDASHDAVE